jgi:indole-3-pyruvate monooxygenase
VLTERCAVVVVGAGPAGLAVAACLRRRGVTPTLIEQGHSVGWSWRGHYDRLHLHTVKQHSGLPYSPFPADVPRYPSRDQVVAYLETYARRFGLAPCFGQRVLRVYRVDSGWCCETDLARYIAPEVVVATGYSRTPLVPTWPGQDRFRGPIQHSTLYRAAAPYRGQRVLVVGMGNTGAEIGLDLAEHGALPTIAVRGPVGILPRDAFGQSTQVVSIRSRWLPAAVRDRLTPAVARLLLGNLERYGLRPPAHGPIASIERYGRVPVLDVGTVKAVKAGRIEIAPGLERFTADAAVFADGRTRPFDAVVLATGYTADVASFVDGAEPALDQRGYPRRPTGDVDGLHFVGYTAAATGLLREIALTAPRVADAIVYRFSS